MPSINLDNLERYDSKARNEAEEEYMSKDSGNWQKTEEAGAVAFYPVPNTPLEGKVKFSFTETPPASGDKSPTNPSAISGVSSVKTGRVGRNLLLKAPPTYSSNPSPVTITQNADGTYTLNGTNNTNSIIYVAITDSAYVFSGSKSSVVLNNAKSYTMSGTLISGSYTAGSTNSTYSFGYSSNNGYYSSEIFPLSGKTSFTLASKPDADGKFIARMNISPGSTFANAVFAFQLEEGSTATDFEAPMLPADANYPLSLGSTYYGGEIDLATGLMTVTWWGEYVSTITNTELASTYVRTTLAVTYGHMGSGTAPTYFRSNYDDDGTYVYPRYSAGTARISISFSYEMLGLDPSTATVETTRTAVESFLAQHPCFVVYKLYTPQTVQLSPTEILSLAQTDKCMPRLNTVYTDADTIQIGYMKSPQRTEQELTQAVLEIESDDSD